jgi:hypothetical protein
LLFAGASFDRSVFDPRAGVARVLGITRARRKHRGEPTRRDGARCADWTSLSRSRPISDVSLVPFRHHRSTSFDRELQHHATLRSRATVEPAGRGSRGSPPVKERPSEDPETPASVHAIQEPLLLVPVPVRHPLRDAVRAPHTRSLDPVFPPVASTPVKVRYRASPRIREVALRLPPGSRTEMLLADRCYPKPLRAPAPRRFPCDVRGGLAPPTSCLESPVFHDTETHRRGSAALFGEAFLPPPCPWTVLRAPLSKHPFEVPTFARKSRDATPRWQRTLVDTAEIASAVDP